MNIHEALSYAKETGNRVKSPSGDVYWYGCGDFWTFRDGLNTTLCYIMFTFEEVMSDDWQKEKVRVRLINPVMSTLMSPIIVKGSPNSVVVTCDGYEGVDA